MANAFTFHKIMTMLNYLDEWLAEKRQTETKRLRAVYYDMIGLDFTSTDMVSEYLEYTCQILQCSRYDLGIEASVKGLIAGAGLTSLDTVEYIQLPQKYVNNQQDLADFKHLKVVLVVEKETVFMHLIQMEWYLQLQSTNLSKHLLIVTAKGQTDFATRKFLQNLSHQNV